MTDVYTIAVDCTIFVTVQDEQCIRAEIAAHDAMTDWSEINGNDFPYYPSYYEIGLMALAEQYVATLLPQRHPPAAPPKETAA